jgi:hypothetical protein
VEAREKMGDTQEPTAGGSRGVVVVVIVVVAVAHCTAPPTRPARSLDVYARLGPGIGSSRGLGTEPEQRA